MQDIVQAARKYLGAPYRFFREEGLVPREFNCYTFVWHVFTEATGRPFPLTIEEQMEAGIPVSAPDPFSFAPGSILILRQHQHARHSRNPSGLHAGVWTGSSLVHASQRAGCVVEEPWFGICRTYALTHALLPPQDRIQT